jgi:hypothetical protein
MCAAGVCTIDTRLMTVVGRSIINRPREIRPTVRLCQNASAWDLCLNLIVITQLIEASSL